MDGIMDEEYFSIVYLDSYFPPLDLTELKKAVEEMDKVLAEIKEKENVYCI
jgi:hypothetical protein